MQHLFNDSSPLLNDDEAEFFKFQSLEQKDSDSDNED